MTPLRTRLEQNIGWGLLLLLFTGGLLVMWPFVTAMLWASVLSYSAWPLYRRLLAWFGGRQTLAALVLALGMVVVVLLPFAMVGLTLADNVDELKAAVQRWLDDGPPDPPQWVADLPLIGTAVADKWHSLAADSATLLREAKRFVEPVGTWLLMAGLKLGAGLLELALSILITFFLLRNGKRVAAQLNNSIERIGGERGRHLLQLAGATVRGVVNGILGTALAQGLMAGVGFLIAGIPGAALLALLTFFLSVVPVGPPLVWLPAALWLFHQGRTGWGIFMLIWGLGVNTIDNFIKPWLISRGGDMPFILILFGVLGGALAFGFIGVFIGPTLLAVLYRLIAEWAAASRAAMESEKAPAPSSPSATIA